MQEDTLPSPHIGRQGHALRRMVAQAISYIQINAANQLDGKHSAAGDLTRFFQAAITALAPFVRTSDADDTEA